MTKYKYGVASSFYTDETAYGQCSEGFGEYDATIDMMSNDLSALIQRIINEDPEYPVTSTPKHKLIGKKVTDIGGKITHVFCDEEDDVMFVIFTNPTPPFPEVI